MLNDKREWTTWTLARASDKIEVFLSKLRDTANVRLACEAADIPRSTAYMWRDKYATFADAWDDALEEACDRLQAEAWKRALEEESDRLLMFLLKAHRPDVYNPTIKQHTEITGEGGGPVVVAIGGIDPDEDI